MKKTLLSTAAALVFSTGFAQAASYTFVSDPGDFANPTILEGFEGFALGTLLPVTSGILTVDSGNAGNDVTLSNAGSITTPGIIEGKYFWDNGDAVDYTFTFSEGISQFGVGIYGMQFGGNSLSLFDESDNLIKTFGGIAGAGFNQAQFAGFQGSDFDVHKVVLDFGGVDAVGIDNVYYSPATIPVPAALPLLMAGLGGLALMRRRRG